MQCCWMLGLYPRRLWVCAQALCGCLAGGGRKLGFSSGRMLRLCETWNADGIPMGFRRGTSITEDYTPRSGHAGIGWEGGGGRLRHVFPSTMFHKRWKDCWTCCCCCPWWCACRFFACCSCWCSAFLLRSYCSFFGRSCSRMRRRLAWQHSAPCGALASKRFPVTGFLSRLHALTLHCS